MAQFLDASSDLCVFGVSILSDICHLKPVRKEDWAHIEFNIKNYSVCNDMWLKSDNAHYI